MVADPVDATLLTLNYYYYKTSNYVATQQNKITKSEYFDKIYQLNPFSQSIYEKDIPKGASDPLYEKILNHVKSNQIQYLSLFTIGIGIPSLVYFKSKLTDDLQSSTRTKRRVPKLSNGARKDVILVVGSPTEPLTRLIALDFEKRGFIVYLTILDQKDLKYVESNPITDDINYINFADSFSYEIQLAKFKNLLNIPVTPFTGAQAHKLNLKAVVFTPNLYFPIGPIENISISSWNRINERLLVYLKIFSSGLIDLMRHQKTKTILMTTNIISSLDMPYHAPETIFQNSLRHLFTALSREIKHQGLSVTQLRLGNLNVTNNQNGNAKISTIVNSEIRNWTDDMKVLYGNTFAKSEKGSSPIKSAGKGTSLRELYHTLFDIIYSSNSKSSVVYCGTGARAYDRVARYIPECIIDLFVS